MVATREENEIRTLNQELMDEELRKSRMAPTPSNPKKYKNHSKTRTASKAARKAKRKSRK